MVQDGNNTSYVAYYKSVPNHNYSSLQSLNERAARMRGPRRVLIFCLLTAVLPTVLLVIPLYLRHIVFADVTYAVAESDVVEIDDGVSSLFCQEHLLRMNSSFQAFQVLGPPRLSGQKKHVRLLKSMSLPDDTLEYWGFYLLRGSTVELSLCSRFEGSRIMVVEGERNLRTCGLMEHSEKPLSTHMANGVGQVRVLFEVERENRTQEATDDAPQLEETDNENLEYVKKLSDDFIARLRTPVNLSNHEEVVTEVTTKKSRNTNNRTKDRKKHVKKDRQNTTETPLPRVKRNLQVKEGHILDAKVGHGHAGNDTANEGKTDESSVSSFENNLLACYDGKILLVQAFPPSTSCSKHQVLHGDHILKTTHEVEADGYYYYIFYSDNDIVQNDIHAVFNIYKPTYEFTDISNKCVNQTECLFPIAFWSDETVIVEVPTKDGLERNDNDTTFLISSCRPRMAVYVIFPVSVLFLILMCAFL